MIQVPADKNRKVGGAQPQENYAGFWIRLVASLIDGIVQLVLPVIGLIINVYLTGEKGYSIGKKVLGLKVIKEDGKYPIGLVDALIREVVGKFISSLLLGLGYLLIGFDSRKQGLHDKIAKTYVVYEK